MWKTVFKRTINNLSIQVNKTSYPKGNHYSATIGVLKTAPEGDRVLPFFDPTTVVDATISDLLYAARSFIDEDKAKDEAIEKKRIDALAGKGSSKNPQANKGLSRFKKPKQEQAQK